MDWTIPDKLVSYFSPMSGVRRYQARSALAEITKSVTRHYEGASGGRRTEGWLAPGSSANTASALALPFLRNRSRDLVRNNTYASRAVSILARHAVGAGITPTANSSSKSRNSKADSLWNDWADSTLCDLNERRNFYGLQKLVMRGVAEGGEVIVRRVRSSRSDLPVPFHLQLLEADFLDHNRTLLRTNATDNFVIQGIEFDANMRRVAYWLFPEHPGGYVTGRLMGVQSERVPASEVLHIFRYDRIGQIHGIPFMAPALVRLKDFDEFEDAQLVREKIAACFAAFIHDPEGYETPAAAQKNGKAAKVMDIEPGTATTLPPGKEITFGTPPAVAGSAEYGRSVLRGISVGTDVTYEQLTGDYSQVNYSSARMAHLEFRQAVEELQWQMLIPDFNRGVWNWFREGATIAGTDLLKVPAKWSTPRPEMIDVDKETRAQTGQIRSGQKSWSQVVREGGEDPEKVAQEMSDDLKRFDRLGLVLDCDPRKTSAQGNAQPDVSKQSEEDKEGSGA